MKRWISFFILSLLLSPVYLKDTLSQNWEFSDAVISNDGLYALTNESAIIKLDNHGNKVWEAKIPADITLKHLIPTKDGVLLAGEILVRLDGNGNLLWAKNVSTDVVTVLPDGEVAFANKNILGLLSQDGNPLWARRLVLKTNETSPGRGIDLTAVVPLHNAILLIGIATIPNDPKSHLLIGAVSLNGTLLWAKVFDTGYYDRPDVGASFEKSGLVAGVYGGGSDAPWISEYFVLKVSPDGEVEWFNSYYCPHKEEWDDFWSMKVLGMACNGTCAVGTTTGTFIINASGDIERYSNVTGKSLRISNDSILVLSNGTLIMVNPRNGSEGKCYTAKVEFREMPINLTIAKAELKVSDVMVEPVIKRYAADDNTEPGMEGKRGDDRLNVALPAVILAGIALVIGILLRNSR
ncbi:PQQ-binding-like beta-propeller repeat protein [Pyrococcus yayanosii]|uniref:Uncharacterized protein n=1 Tax=Pyrococcus yayanosii (strain CH1 / JCM 16557) TaxID=529709 RepID=F8AGE5_PYRYC|nr:hypothetical protein [Pyrococcus yayanosii]AEH25141.1 hypothetical protein PYCH_14710 [Pyrococcus yayanosii CH1]